MAVSGFTCPGFPHFEFYVLAMGKHPGCLDKVSDCCTVRIVISKALAGPLAPVLVSAAYVFLAGFFGVVLGTLTHIFTWSLRKRCI